MEKLVTFVEPTGLSQAGGDHRAIMIRVPGEQPGAKKVAVF
jgi:hypothetical protein